MSSLPEMLIIGDRQTGKRMQFGIITVYVNLLKNLINIFPIFNNWSVVEKSLSIKTEHWVKKSILSQYIRTLYRQALLYFVRI